MKSKLLTHLFVEWVKTSEDLEAIEFLKGFNPIESTQSKWSQTYYGI